MRLVYQLVNSLTCMIVQDFAIFMLLEKICSEAEVVTSPEYVVKARVGIGDTSIVRHQRRIRVQHIIDAKTCAEVVGEFIPVGLAMCSMN